MNRRMRLMVFFCMLLFGASWAQAGEIITPQLSGRMAQARPDELIRIYVVMERQADLAQLRAAIKGLSKDQRRQMVIDRLSEVSQEAQVELLTLLEKEQAQGKVARIRPLRLGNMVACKATKEIIQRVAALKGINYINWDRRMKVLHDAPREIKKPLRIKRVRKARARAEELPTIRIDLGEDGVISRSKEIPWNITLINADDVWGLGYTGEGVIVSHLDTGVNYDHLDLRDHMWDGSGVGMPHHGYDFANGDTDPMDDQGHGTHTAGTIASDGTAGSQVGVAPDAQIMVFKIWFSDGTGYQSDAWDAMEYSVIWGADVVSMSGGWLHDSPYTDLCQWRLECDALMAAGIVFCTSAGNGNPDPPPNHLPVPNDISTPADVPAPWYPPPNPGDEHHSSVLAIGATNSIDYICFFSSYGPTEWDVPVCGSHDYDDYQYPPGLLKPDVCAPGLSIKSLDYADTAGYAGPAGWQGTSMSCPHVAGALALMLSKNPNLTPVQMDSILEVTAVDRGPAGRDSLYGAGRIDALAAVNATPGTGQPPEAIADLEANLSNGTKSSSGDITLSWTEPSSDLGIDYYVIYRAADPDASMDSLNSTTDTTYTDAGAAGSTATNYYYTVKAVDQGGQKSSQSNKVGEFDIQLIAGVKSQRPTPRTLQIH